MTLKEARERTLKLADCYSDGGAVFDEQSEITADMRLKIDVYLDVAQKQAATIQKIVHTLRVESGEPVDGAAYCRAALPQDFGRLLFAPHRVAVVGTELRFPKEVLPFEIVYAAVPQTITAETPEDTVLEVSENAASALPFFAAANLLLYDEPNAYNCLLAQYNNMLANLDSDKYADYRRVKNAYGGEVRHVSRSV